MADRDRFADEAAYDYYKDQGGKLTYDEWINTGKPIPGEDYLYNNYVNRGGLLSFADWKEIGSPSGPTEGVDLPVTEGDDPGITYPKPDIWEPGDPEPGVNGDDVVGEEDFAQQLAAAVERMRLESRELYEFERGETQRLGARDIGKMSRMQQQALLARGRTPAEIEQLTARGQEAGARSLNDLLQALSIGQKQQQARIGEVGIGAMISGEELGIREQQLAQQARQYQQTFGEQRRQFGVGAGFTQQRLAQQQQQAQASTWAPLWGALGQIGGGALGSIFGPAGTAAGSYLGGKVTSWLGG